MGIEAGFWGNGDGYASFWVIDYGFLSNITRLHIGCPVRSKVKVDLVIGVLWEFKASSREPWEMAPQLGINVHQFGNIFGIGLFVSIKFFLACTIVNKSNHQDGGNRGEVVWGCECECGAIAFLFVAVE
jgi:hypothetical protein